VYKTKVYIFAVLISLYMCYIQLCTQKYLFVGVGVWGKGADIDAISFIFDFKNYVTKFMSQP